MDMLFMHRGWTVEGVLRVVVFDVFFGDGGHPFMMCDNDVQRRENRLSVDNSLRTHQLGRSPESFTLRSEEFLG